MANSNQEQQDCQRIIDFIQGLSMSTDQYQSLFAPDKQAHRLLAFFWMYRLHFPRSYRQWPPSARLLAMFEKKFDAYEGGTYDPTPFLQEHQRLLPRSLSKEHPYPWHLEEDARLVREAEKDRQELDTWVRKQIRSASVDEETHLSRTLSQLHSVPFGWHDFLSFVRGEWENAEVRILQSNHSFVVAQHTVYKQLRDQLVKMGRLA
jgi:hypothetical protein